MWLVLMALKRPITILVALAAIALGALLALQRMPVDIFPKGGDPAIYVAQPYGGMDPAQMHKAPRFCAPMTSGPPTKRVKFNA